MFFYLFCFLILSQTGHSLKPKLSGFLKSQSQNQNSKFKLSCFVEEGSKPLEFRWFLDNSEIILKNSDRNIQIVHSEDESILKIDNLSKENTGNYSCFVKNSYGTDVQSSVLLVKGLIFEFL